VQQDFEDQTALAAPQSSLDAPCRDSQVVFDRVEESCPGQGFETTVEQLGIPPGCPDPLWWSDFEDGNGATQELGGDRARYELSGLFKHAGGPTGDVNSPRSKIAGPGLDMFSHGIDGQRR
jgi:hypothetical protein